MTGKTILKRIAALGAERRGFSKWLPSAAEAGVRLAVSFVLTMTDIPGGYSPFAVGFVAAAPPGMMSAAALAGAFAGYFLFGEADVPLKYSAMCLLAAAAVFVFRDTRIFRRTYFRPLAAGAMAACTGIVYVYDAGWAMPAAAAFACETAAIAASARAYQLVLTPWQGGFDRVAETKRRTSLLLCLVSLLSSLAGTSLFGTMSVGRALAALCVLLLAFSGGIAGGAVCGAVIGTMMDVSSGTLFFAVLFTLGGMAAALLRHRGRFVSVITYTGCATLIALCLWENLPDDSVLYETFAAGVLFLLLPARVMTKAGSFFPAPVSGYGAMLARECARRRASDTADAFLALAEAVRVRSGEGMNDENIALVFDRASERVCRKCAGASRCWGAGYQTTLGVFNDLTAGMRETGLVTAQDFPDYFECTRLPQLSSAITEELRAQRVRRQYKSRVLESRGTAAGQYTDMADILSSIAGDLGCGASFEPELERKLVKYLRTLDIEASAAVFRDRGGRLRAELSGSGIRRLGRDPEYLDKLSAVAGTRLCTTEEGMADGRLMLLEAEPLSVTVGTASLKCRGESTNGDRALYFKTDDGRLCVLLSDGVGTGDDAARCSAAASGILERLLRAGAPPETALHLLNDLMLLKNDDAAESATVDLLCLNLFSGEADVYKFGAAPSYVAADGVVRRLTQQDVSAPLGSFQDACPERSRVKLPPGSMVVVASDGVTRGLDDGWLCDILSEPPEEGAKELARRIVDSSSGMFGADDDITALVVLVDERK